MLAVLLLAAVAFVPVLHEGDAVPALPLVDQSGRAFSLQAFRGDAVVVSFVYTRCADARMCPLVSAKFARMQRAIGSEPIRLVTLTLDPAYDTPAVLRRYGTAYGQDGIRWVSGTGSPEVLDELGTRFGIATARTRPGRVLHTEAALVLDREARVARIVDGNSWTPDDVLALAREAAGTRSSGQLAHVRVWLTQAAAFCGGGRAPLTALAVLGILAAATLASVGMFARAFRTPSAEPEGEGGQAVPRPSA